MSPRNVNFGTLTATNTEASAATSTATVAAIAKKAIHITGFDGASSDQPFKVELKIGGVTEVTMQGSADTTVGREFGDDHPIVATDNTAVTVVTTPAASGNCTANVYYKIGF